MPVLTIIVQYLILSIICYKSRTAETTAITPYDIIKRETQICFDINKNPTLNVLGHQIGLFCDVYHGQIIIDASILKSVTKLLSNLLGALPVLNSK